MQPRTAAWIIALCLAHHPVEAITARYRLSKLALPLVGGPKFLRLHSAACFERVTAGSTGGDNAQRSPSCIVLDFLPLEAENPATLKALLLGKRMPGEIRCKEREWPSAGVVVGLTKEVDVDIDVLVMQLKMEYDARLHLLQNNCQDFVSVIFDYCETTSNQRLDTCQSNRV